MSSEHSSSLDRSVFDCPKCSRGFKTTGELANWLLYHGCCTLHERFMARITKTEAGCWIYGGAKDKWGYTHIGVKGKRIQAHRYSYEHYKGPITVGLQILHSCDNNACVNPEHMSLGTDADNRRDAQLKGRTTWGEKNSHAVLTADQVLEIRKLYKKVHAKKSNAKELAARFGVSSNAINAIACGRTWRQLRG